MRELESEAKTTLIASPSSLFSYFQPYAPPLVLSRQITMTPKSVENAPSPRKSKGPSKVADVEMATPLMEHTTEPLLANEPKPRRRFSFQNNNDSASSFRVIHKESEQQLKKKRVVQYDTDNHCTVLFQMYGSVWPHVLPYCLASVALTYLIAYLRDHHVDLTFPSSNGHNFMAIMVSFLVVTRANITYARFMEAREHLSQCYRCCRELMHHVCILTVHDTSEGAKLWRQNVAYRTILLLRVTMAAVEFPSSSINTWDVVGSHEHEKMELLTPTSERQNLNENSTITPQMERMSKWAHGERTMADENFRAPVVLAYNLREQILIQRNGNFLQKELHVNEELKMLGFVSEFMSAFAGLKKLITTPFPFPLVQMNRTFLFFWVLTLPLVLVHAMDHTWHVALIMFFISYGFLGLEYVSMELEDPFGDDPNDLDNLGWAEMCFEDIYIAIYKMDGSESAEQLRQKVMVNGGGDALDNYHSNLDHEAF